MIKLTQLNDEVFVLNADLIRYVEARPDTFITLTTGERVVVKETMDEVLERAVRYQQSKHLIPAPLRPNRAPRGTTASAGLPTRSPTSLPTSLPLTSGY